MAGEGFVEGDAEDDDEAASEESGEVEDGGEDKE